MLVQVPQVLHLFFVLGHYCYYHDHHVSVLLLLLWLWLWLWLWYRHGCCSVCEEEALQGGGAIVCGAVTETKIGCGALEGAPELCDVNVDACVMGADGVAVCGCVVGAVVGAEDEGVDEAAVLLLLLLL